MGNERQCFWIMFLERLQTFIEGLFQDMYNLANRLLRRLTACTGSNWGTSWWNGVTKETNFLLKWPLPDLERKGGQIDYPWCQGNYFSSFSLFLLRVWRSLWTLLPTNYAHVHYQCATTEPELCVKASFRRAQFQGKLTSTTGFPVYE